MSTINGVKHRVVELPKDKYGIKAPYTMTPKGITIHNTYNDASAANEIAYMQRNNNAVSFHFAVDDKEAVQGLPLDRNSWNAGDGANGYGNRNTISYEICYSKSGGKKFEKATENTVKVVAFELHKRKWGIDKVKKHQDWSGKYCPHRILDNREWDKFKRDVKRELDRLNGETVKPKPTPQPTPTPTPKPSTESSAETGKRVVSIYKGKEGLNFYDGPRWDRPTGKFYHGQGWTIISKIKVGTAYQYKVKNSRGAIYYVTASSKYVTVQSKTSAPTPKPQPTPTLKVGGKVKIKATAKNYVRTPKPVAIPPKYKNKTLTVAQVATNDVLIKELTSWVRKTDVNVV